MTSIWDLMIQLKKYTEPGQAWSLSNVATPQARKVEVKDTWLETATLYLTIKEG